MLEQLFFARNIELLKLPGGGAVPLRFSDARAEHLATRAAAGLFDFSFMEMAEVSGPDARAFLERVQTRNLAMLAPGSIAYTLLLRDDGSVFNDATIWCHASDRFWVFTGRRGDFRWLEESLNSPQPRGAARLTRLSGQYAVLALQGPRTFDILPRALDLPLGELRYFNFGESRLADVQAFVGRLGYSGELGCEIVVPASAGADAWRKLAEIGAGVGLRECGFEAANSLRIESGHILFSAELVLPANPYELGLARLLNGSDFIGSAALRHRRWAAPRRRLGGIVPLDSGRAGSGERPTAQITSEAYSPLFARTLAMGFIDAKLFAPGSLLRLTDGRRARSARLPFYDPGRMLPRKAVSTSAPSTRPAP
jgi:glycine cleavage system T protein (aminomethyltransferase)